MAAIQPTLDESNAWDPEIEEAWNCLFKLITYGMSRGYVQPKQTPEEQNSPSLQGDPVKTDETLQATDVAPDIENNSASLVFE